MIATLLRRLLRLDQNDQEIKKIQEHAEQEIGQAVLQIKRAGKMQEVFVKKTANYYMAKSMGLIK